MAIQKLTHQQATILAEKGTIDETKLAAIWMVVRPFIVMASKIPFIGKKVRKYITIFVSAIDNLVEQEEE